jgi:septal ring factor EnvC (AmiA/AmiB activator)
MASIQELIGKGYIQLASRFGTKTKADREFVRQYGINRASVYGAIRGEVDRDTQTIQQKSTEIRQLDAYNRQLHNSIIQQRNINQGSQQVNKQLSETNKSLRDQLNASFQERANLEATKNAKTQELTQAQQDVRIQASLKRDKRRGGRGTTSAQNFRGRRGGGSGSSATALSSNKSGITLIG